MNIKNVLRGLLVTALVSTLVYGALAAITDIRATADALRSFPLGTLLAMLALSTANYLVRAVRWRYLVRLAGGDMGYRDAAYVQLSGTTMTVTPGKVGEVLKALLAREISGLPMSKGVALVFSERLADVVAVTALSAGAVGLVAQGGVAVVAAGAVLGVLLAALSSERMHRLALSVALKQRWMRRHQEAAEAASETVRASLAAGPLIVSSVAAAVAWALEGLAFAACLKALGFDGLSVPAAVAIYAISTLAGAFSFMPGGVGLTEASLAGLLVAVGAPGSTASAATLLIRLVTLWYGVALGWAVLATRPRVLRHVLAGSEPASTDAEALDAGPDEA